MKLSDAMKNKNILIQDVGEQQEIDRFFQHNVYRRPQYPRKDKTIDFFAPYFTAAAQQKIVVRGISCYAPILTRYSGQPSAVQKYISQHKSEFEIQFGSQLVHKWESGLQIADDSSEQTYYFLGEPIDIPNPILKETSGILRLSPQLPGNMLKPMSDFCNVAGVTAYI